MFCFHMSGLGYPTSHIWYELWFKSEWFARIHHTNLTTCKDCIFCKGKTCKPKHIFQLFTLRFKHHVILAQTSCPSKLLTMKNMVKLKRQMKIIFPKTMLWIEKYFPPHFTSAQWLSPSSHTLHLVWQKNIFFHFAILQSNTHAYS